MVTTAEKDVQTESFPAFSNSDTSFQVLNHGTNIAAKSEGIIQVVDGGLKVPGTVLAPSHSDVNLQPSSHEIEIASRLEGFTQVADGGFTAWTTALGSWLIQIATFGYTNSFGVYQDFYVRTYLSNSSSSQISWIGSTQLLLLLGLGLFTGRALDRGYFYHTTIIGSVLFSVSIFMLSLTKPQQYYQIFLSQSVGMGLGAGLLFVPSLGIIAHHFKRRRSLVLGLVATGSGIGGVIHPIMLDRLLLSQGFRKTVLASAGLNTGLLVIAIALMRTTLPVGKQTFRQQINQYKGFIREREFCITAIAIFILNLGLFFPIFYLQLFSLNHQAGPVLSFYTLAILNASSIVGRVIPNLFLERFGIFNMMVILAVASTALVFGMLGLTSAPGIIVFSILYGYFIGSIIGVTPPMIASFAKDPSEIGIRNGIIYSLNALASLVGPPVMGALLTSHLYWIRPILFSGISFAVSVVVFVLLRFLVAQRAQDRWV